MKKPIIMLAAASVFVAATVFSSCMSNVDKKEMADRKVEREKENVRDEKADVRDAREDLQDARQEANLQTQKLTPEEWKKFKDDAEVRIKKNEAHITELRSKIKESGTALDENRTKKIAELEEQNWELRTRVNSFDSKKGNYDEFKREFDHDVNEIGNSLKDITVDNKK